MTNESQRAQLQRTLKSWRDSLIDISGRNRLLNFRHTRTATLEIKRPEALAFLDRLQTGWEFAELPEDDDDFDAGLIDFAIVTQKETDGSLRSALHRLRSIATQAFNDTGLWVLQLGAGFLDWREPGSEVVNSAPLLLYPVALERDEHGDYRLRAAEDEDPIPNPALAVKMAQLGFAWPDPDEMKDLPGTLNAVRAVIRGRDGWEVSDRVVLATFQSHKEAMYRDLLDHEDQVLDHPMVQVIALGPKAELPGDALDFDPVDPDRIDELQAPEQIPLVLDADTSQRQCVAAALDGRSFVMDGPPGTGKSQTIANMIAALMHAGRSVLFVSEKAAALDVVQNRLEDVGLGSFILPLHSHKATRKQVATALGDAVLERPVAVGRMDDNGRRHLRGVREQLSAYAAAMNEVRQPLNRSAHDVIGVIDVLRDVPSLPVRLPEALTGESLYAIVAAAERIAESWRPVAEGARFAWRGLTVSGSPRFALDLLAERTDAFGRRLETYRALVEYLLIETLDDTGQVIDLLDATADRPPVPVSWLTAPALDRFRTAVADFTNRLGAIRTEEAALTDELSDRWDLLPRDVEPGVPSAEAALAGLVPEGVDPAPFTASQLRTLADEFEATARMLARHVDTLADIAADFGMSAPATLPEAFALHELTAISRATDRPEEQWLRGDGRADAQRAADELERDLVAHAAAEAAAAGVFTDKVLAATDLADLARRFADEHHGVRRLTGAYRADKQRVAELTVTGECDKTVIARLPQAVAWQEADARLRRSIAVHSGTLGGYWADRQTNFGAIRQALTAAARIAELTANAIDRTTLASQVTAGGHAKAETVDAADAVQAELADWYARLVPAPRPGGRPRLAQGTLADAARWYAAHVEVFRSAAQTASLAQGICAHEPAPTLSRAREVIARVQAHRARAAEFERSAADDRMLLGDLYAGRSTQLDQLRRAVDWAASVRREDRPMPPDTAHALLDARPDPGLARLHASWREALDGFCGLFEERPDLRRTVTGALPDVRAAIDALRADGSGPEEWQAVRAGREVLRAYGLDDMVDRAAALGLDAGRFPDVVRRSVLDAWVEHHLREDGRFGSLRAVGRDRLVEEFRDLDRTLVSNARADVIAACNARRPRPNVGQAAILRNEAQKKTRHMPVRSLLERTADVVQRVKPCFMMSPLTVSQFLPPSFHFDVVVFDEASQVLPQDAINCVYRAGSLIVAGDQKQLPPTNFFAHTEDEDDEYDEEAPDSFESLLDMCKGVGVLPSLSLRWHYRSRHESLIAFSNSEFYDDKLVSFPSAWDTGDDFGVTFTKVDGVYDRGGSRTNAIEAKAVAERVLHHYATRPKLSLGVIAMSEAQARAIEEAVDQARRERPDLDHLFPDDQDRLNGFFVKNLETVQGDERDVILLSVGYGPDATGKTTMTFGPLNRQDGWRRLNVAVTRARQRVEVISSISGGAIRESENASLNHFKRYLDYAERGQAVLRTVPASVEAGPESPFEESVLDTLGEWGYDVQPQVGVAGYRIDLAVRHPDQPGRYAIGIECDGAMYHSSRAARDRDRLREGVLRGLGWTLHRIWGTDWYRERAQAAQRLRTAVDEAIERMRTESAPQAPAEEAVEPSPILPETPAGTEDEAAPARPETPAPRVRMVTVDSDPDASWAVPYRRAHLDTVADGFSLDHPRARPMLTRMFRTVIEAEAPMMQDLLFRRVADAWGVTRVGPRIRESLQAALKAFLRQDPDVDRIAQNSADHVITLRGRKVVPRFNTEDVSRRISDVPVIERETALLRTVEESPGITEEELRRAVARVFGWRRMGGDIRAALTDDLTGLAGRGLIEGLPDRIRMVTPD
ncbi:DUF3320 domain-containing protein [Actinoallomurus sp. NPDC050550]|uniref:DUF3320 domain-containing protein n=1 Tax=Actinoallomurus sp. NPDC050550 TaxID=3154937 RepID=UPI00340C02AE